MRNEFVELRRAGFDMLVSLLTSPEASELGLLTEAQNALEAGLQFESLPILDFSTPDNPTFMGKLFEMHDRLRSGAAIAAHCRGSVGRAPLTIAGILVLDGADPDDAWSRISIARGVPVPDTDAQRRWVSALSARA